MRVATKLATGYGLLILLLTGLVLYHLAAVRAMRSTNVALGAVILRLSATATDQLARLDQLEENGSKYWITRDAGYRARFDVMRAEFDGALRELAALDLSAEERSLLDALSAEWPRLFPPGATLDDLVAARSGRAPEGAAFDVWLAGAVRELRDGTRAIFRASEREMERQVAASVAAARRVETLSLAALAAALAVSVVVFVLVVRSISGPLAQLRRGTHAVAGGDLEHHLERPSTDEFSELADDFNVMTGRLRELERAKRDFISQVSHDLKTPLASMQDANALLLEEIPGPLNERQKRLLEHTGGSARRLAAMLGKLLDVSRMEAGGADYRFERCDLRGVVREAAQEFESAAERRGIALQVDAPEPALTVQCDPERVRQVVANLIENAVRFSPEGGTIRAELRAYRSTDSGVDADGAGFALVGVSDQGQGVPDEEKTRIFDRFHQGAQQGPRAGGGVGLGLAICKEIVRAHGGRIWVSDAPGGGSQFSFLLPLAVAERA